MFSVALVFLGTVSVWSILRSGAAAPAQVVSDVGKFRVGSVFGEERAGFSGRALLEVFVSPNLSDWPEVAACLQSPGVEAELGFFTPILIDEQAEPKVKVVFRERDGLRVVVRSISGGFLGGLPAGFSCDDLVGLLRSIRELSKAEPRKSPIYSVLLQSPAVIDDLIANKERAKAARFVELFRELEGPSSPAVTAAEARLHQ